MINQRWTIWKNENGREYLLQKLWYEAFKQVEIQTIVIEKMNAIQICEYFILTNIEKPMKNKTE